MASLFHFGANFAQERREVEEEEELGHVMLLVCRRFGSEQRNQLFAYFG